MNRFGKAVGKMRSNDGPARDAQGIFQRGIRKQDGTVAVDDRYQRGQQVKGLKPDRGRIGRQSDR